MNRQTYQQYVVINEPSSEPLKRLSLLRPLRFCFFKSHTEFIKRPHLNIEIEIVSMPIHPHNEFIHLIRIRHYRRLHLNVPETVCINSTIVHSSNIISTSLTQAF